jgi:hypothetical protein
MKTEEVEEGAQRMPRETVSSIEQQLHRGESFVTFSVKQGNAIAIMDKRFDRILFNWESEHSLFSRRR